MNDGPPSERKKYQAPHTTADRGQAKYDAPNTTADRGQKKYEAPNTTADHPHPAQHAHHAHHHAPPAQPDQRERRLRDVEWEEPGLAEGVKPWRPEMQNFDGGGGTSEQHSWRVVTRKDPTAGDQWGLTDRSADGTRAGRVYAPGGAAKDVDSEWNDYTKGDAVSGWLEITCAVAAGAFTITTAEIVTEEPTADPFNATAPVFVFRLFDIFADGSISEYQTSDISLEGLPAFDDTTKPENIVPDTAESGDAKDPSRRNHKHKFDMYGWTIPDPSDLAGTAAAGTHALPAHADHQHKTELPTGGSAYQVLQRNSTNTMWVIDDVRMTT